VNTNFVNIIKRIIAEQGEGILADPQRLKEYIRDYASDVPQDERRAFGRCIERGFYAKLKGALSKDERTRLKLALSRQLQAETSMDLELCKNALDLLEKVIFDAARNETARLENKAHAAMATLAAKIPISKKTVFFALAAGFAIFLGEYVSDDVRSIFAIPNTFWGRIFDMAIWTGTLSFFITLALIITQHIYSKKIPTSKILIPLFLAVITGAFSGGLGQFVFNYSQRVNELIKNISNALCWGIGGIGIGLGAALFIQNYPKKRAMLAGAIGGTIGGIIYVAVMNTSRYGSLIGVIILGISIGLIISFVEESLREAWLTIVWGPKEITTIALGKKPVCFGSFREADVFLPRPKDLQNAPAIRAVFTLENGKVIMDDKQNGIRKQLQPENQIDLGRVKVVVNIKNR
jgi:hypothetical protein